MRTLTIQLPDDVYTQLQHGAQQPQSSPQVAAHRLQEALSAPLPVEMEQALRVLAWLSDDVLLAVARSKMAPAQQRRWKRLLSKQSQTTLLESEQQELEHLMTEGDRLTLWKAQAYLLLKERGHHLPELARLQKNV